MPLRSLGLSICSHQVINREGLLDLQDLMDNHLEEVLVHKAHLNLQECRVREVEDPQYLKVR